MIRFMLYVEINVCVCCIKNKDCYVQNSENKQCTMGKRDQYHNAISHNNIKRFTKK